MSWPESADTVVDTPAADILSIDAASLMRGTRLVLDRVSLRVACGQHTVLLGSNGSGKSSLVRLIARQLYPLAGDDGHANVRLFGESRWDIADLHRLLGIVSPAMQNDYTSDRQLQVFDAVVSGFFSARGLGLHHQVTATMREDARHALRSMGGEALAERSMASLSTGEARRVLIARALVHRPRALLLDEPCAGLDMVSRRHFLESLRKLAQTGTTLLLVTHHVEEILPEIEQVVLLREGRVVYQGHKDDVLTGEHLTAAFGMAIQVDRRGDYYAAGLI